MPVERGSRRSLLVIGAGGHAAVVIEVARAAGWNPVVALDPGFHTEILGVPVIGGDEKMEAVLATEDIDGAAVAIGNNLLRTHLADRLRHLNCPTPAIVHPAATFSASAEIGEGTVVMAQAVINARAKIGRDCIINTAAVVEHDCILGDGVHVAPRSVMGGTCKLGPRTLFGIGSSARPAIVIGANVIVGAGSVVVADIADGVTVAGVPAGTLARSS